jgi:diguanylate cyclase (GGDEF)-like protein
MDPLMSHQRLLNAYLTCVGLCGVAFAVGLVWFDRGQLLGPTPGLVLVFLAGLVAADLTPASWLTRQQLNVTTSWVFSFGIMLAGAPVLAIVAASVVGALGVIALGKPPLRVLFNAGQIALSLSGGLLLLHLGGVESALLSSDPIPLQWFVVAPAAAITVFVLNAVFVGIAMSMMSDQPFRSVVTMTIQLSCSTDGLLMAMAPVCVVVGQRNVLLLPLIAFTIVSVLRSAQTADARTRDAEVDDLTRLLNRRGLLQHGAAALDSALAADQTIAILAIDLDGFKAINDTYGHASGDELLRVIAERLRSVAPAVEIVARPGGDEFVVVTSCGIDRVAAVELARIVGATMSEPVELVEGVVSVGASIGVACAPSNGSDLLAVLEAADRAMLRAKSAGEGVAVAVRRRQAPEAAPTGMAGDIEQAIAEHQLTAVFQPRLDTVTRQISGVEALVRWDRPGRRPLLPAAFLPGAERSEAMRSVTRLMLAEGLAQAKRWSDAGHPIAVSVNVSPRDLAAGQLVNDVAEALSRSGVPARLLELECTERALLGADLAEVQVAIGALRALGVRIVLDDFGAGMSSITGLVANQIDAIKIDASVTARVAVDSHARAMAASIIDLGRRLGLDVIAEGVEHVDVLEALEELQCPHVQGYLLCRPAPAVDLDALIASATRDRDSARGR